jgi:peptidoglycan/xylan/chitin deacetylase (PgdA/CDA1 family)
MPWFGSALTVLFVFLVTTPQVTSPTQAVREIAVTIDDLPLAASLNQDLARGRQVTRDLLDALVRHHVPAIGFVNEIKLEDAGRVNPERVALLRQWIDAGLELGNHTRTHPDLHRVALEDFKADVLAGEQTTRPLLRAAGKDLKYFRHPFLHTGRTAHVRAGFEAFLTQHGYRVAPVTMDNYDYLFAAAYERAVSRGDAALQHKILEAYLDYMDKIFGYYEQQSRALVGRDIPHTLLLHANALNASAFDRLAGLLTRRGYRFVSLDRALEDPVYKKADEYFGQAGITWLHRWAITEGKKGTFFAGEPEVPKWIESVT